MEIKENALSKSELVNLQTIANIIHLTILHRKQVGIIKETGKACFVIQEEDGKLHYSPIGDEKETLFFDETGEKVFFVDNQNFNALIHPEFTLNLP